LVGFAYNLLRSERPRIVEDPTRKTTVAQPVVAEMRLKRPIYPIPESYFKAADYFEHLAGKNQVVAVQGHAFLHIPATGLHVSSHPISG
jgi:hypothetical protein